jgi:MarR family transcriptional regulator for hemolysin
LERDTAEAEVIKWLTIANKVNRDDNQAILYPVLLIMFTMYNNFKCYSTINMPGCNHEHLGTSVAGSYDLLNDDYKLWRLLDYTCRLIKAASSKALQRCRLSDQTAIILSAVDLLDNNPMPIELARLGKRKPQTMTAILNRMTKQGLILKTIDEHKKNIRRISLTPKGQLALQRAADITAYHKIFSSLSREKREQLKECLEELRDIAQKLCKIRSRP